MRKKIVAGNWKMNTDLESGKKLAVEVNQLIAEKGNPEVKVVLIPPFTHIFAVLNSVNSQRIEIGAQNCSSESKGAFTGEVSVEMIKSIGATHVIIGHSERRNYFKETDEMLNKKTKLSLEIGLTPIFCCGETLEQRNAKNHFSVVEEQLNKGIFGFEKNDFEKIVIAYEPVWAIGTGLNATPEQAQEMHFFIRNLISKKFGNETAENISILYGGSCNAANASQLFANQDVDGGLIGGASLKANDFLGIINAF